MSDDDVRERKEAGVSERERGLARAIGRRREAMVADLARHVAIPTGGNFAPGLDEYRGLLTERLRALGAAVEMVPGEPKPDWLFGAGPGAGPIPPTAVCRRARDAEGSATRVLIACHVDTVFDPRGSFRAMTMAGDGKTAVGPGVVDMKGGALIAVNALEALEEAGIPVSWTVLLNSDEETGSYHSEAALRAEAARHDVGVATEPALPGGELAVERLGSGQFVIEATGRSAHVGRDFASGISAVTALAEAIVSVSKMPDAARGRIVSIGPLEGSTATNVVPERALAWGNARFPSKEVADELEAMLASLETRRGAGAGGAGLPRIVVKRSFNRPAKPLTAGVERLALEARAVAEGLGQRLPFGKTGGVCDGNILQDAGLATVDTLGVRGGGLHTTGEWIEIPSLVERCALLAGLLARVSESGPGHWRMNG